jgi:hypothetical protein
LQKDISLNKNATEELLARCSASTVQVAEVLCRKYLGKMPDDIHAWSYLHTYLLAQKNYREVRLLTGKMLSHFSFNQASLELGIIILARAGFHADAYKLGSHVDRRIIATNPDLAKTMDGLNLLHKGSIDEKPACKQLDEVDRVTRKFNREARKESDKDVEVMFHLKEKWHYPIQREIAERLLAKGICCLFSDSAWFVLAAKPGVLVVSEALYDELPMIRSGLPGCRIVNTRHGLGDKNHAALGGSQSDFLCVSSAAIGEMLERETLTPGGKIWITGYPQMDPLFRQLLKNRTRRHNRGKRVLFAPTFNPGLSAGFLLEEDLVHRIRGDNEDIEIIIRPHPHFTSQNPDIMNKWSNEAASRNNVILETGTGVNLMDLFHECDLMISDVSSAALAWFSTDRPLVCLLDPRSVSSSENFSPDGLEFKMLEGAIVISDPLSLSQSVVHALENPAHLSDKRKKIRQFMFGNLQDGQASGRIADRIESLLRANDR